ncbi:MAG: ABC transporter ATP-binding protein, partial [Acidimicrobiia bacterium]
MTTTAVQDEVAARRSHGAMRTIRRGLSLSPELRKGLPGTIAIALVATAGRVIVPVVIQQIIDGGFSGERVDMTFVIQMTVIALVAVLVTAGFTGWMHLRLAKVS